MRIITSEAITKIPSGLFQRLFYSCFVTFLGKRSLSYYHQKVPRLNKKYLKNSQNLFSGWLLLCLALVLFAFSVMDTSITLQEALDNNQVKVKISSLGHYQGESTLMEIQNLTKNDLNIKVEAGRKLVCDKEEYQNLLVVREQEILVKANSKASKNIVGFCCESDDRGPGNNLVYKVNKMADTSLVKLARYVNSNYKQLSTNSVQQAIWAISNNHGSAAIGITNEKEMSLKHLVCNLKGEPLPWYVIKQRIYQSPNGNIHLVNDSLYGKMAYTNGSWTYSKLNIYDTKDNAVLISIGGWLKPGSSVYDVAIPIKNLGKGKYKLTLENDKQVFTQKEILI